MPITNDNASRAAAELQANADSQVLKNVEFVKNFDYIKNKPIDVTSNALPTVTLKADGRERPVSFLYGDTQVAQIRNGAIYNAVIDSDIVEKHSQDRIAPGKASIKDGALSLGLNRFRIASPADTETQKILSRLRGITDPEQRRTELTKLVANGSTQAAEGSMRLKMVNDPVRRAFESYYAKHALQDYFRSPDTYKKFVDISNNQVNYIKDNYVSAPLFEKYEAAWKNQSFDTSIVGLDQLQGFYTRAEKTLETLNISPEARTALFDIYKHRYLSYALKNEPDVEAKLPSGHWGGVFDPIRAPGKGRIELNAREGNLFRQADSHNVGILRNIDATPRDLRLNDPFNIKYESDYQSQLLASASTRCPDRLEMQDPAHPDASKPGSYLKTFFEKGTGTYVNGPSGSIVIEQGAVRACKDVHANTRPEDLETYLAIQALLFIYVDGGHSMDEITYALTHPTVQDKLHHAFSERPGFEHIGDKLFMNARALENAAKDAAVFNDVLKAKDATHQQITHGNPAGQPARTATKALALAQTVAARNVLYKPSDVLTQELAGAAGVLHRVVSNLSPQHQNLLGAHLLGEGRLLAGQTTDDLLAALARAGSGAASATDRAVAIALMGDIGGFYTTPGNADQGLMTALNRQLQAQGLEVPDAAAVQRMREHGGSAAVGPDKRAERKVRAFDSPADMPFRAGVHNNGLEADKALNVPASERIPDNRWAVFDIGTARVKETTEPLVGHMSASPAEILQAWDMLRGVSAHDQYVGALPDGPRAQDGGTIMPMSVLAPAEQDQRYARAAGAGAFLVGLGYHSAVEVLEGTLVYTGQSIRAEGTLDPSQRDSADVFGHGAATDLMSELFKSGTAA
ncbi:hypothetical protein C4J89_3553 [Pseudomonas sp. R4-35-07]|uniref:hypothetical protein n=1 Tax=unclassified Pseudomonas TaxID=196821 RepID=UPI000F569EDF|nr:MULTISPECIES: hypothetical protein [unclassified Pseudomonas]AZF22439.1 hypothetical protein C4J91_3705 [Pseudomonas sp. R3-52-08]AZF33012.1 hypothetical protein C4J89_3553 [Pseudomonas sp. R4-35-07]